MKSYHFIILLVYTLGDNIFDSFTKSFISDSVVTRSSGVECYNFERDVGQKAFHKMGILSQSIPDRSSRLRRTNENTDSPSVDKIDTAVFENEEEMVAARAKTGVLAYVRNLDTFFGKLLGGWSPFTMGQPVEILPEAAAHISDSHNVEDDSKGTEIDVTEIEEGAVENPIEKTNVGLGVEIVNSIAPTITSIVENGDDQTGDVFLEEKQISSKESREKSIQLTDDDKIKNLHTHKEEVKINYLKEATGYHQNIENLEFSKSKEEDSKEKSLFYSTKGEGVPISTTDDDAPSSRLKSLRLVALNDARTGNLNGIKRVNYECQLEAYEAGMDGTFRAFLSSENLHLHSILSPTDSVDSQIVNSDGDMLFKSYQDLISRKGKLNITNIIAPIYSFNKKNIIFDEHWPFNLVWHGQPDEEVPKGHSKRCDEWTSEDPYLKGITSDYLFKGLLYTRLEPCDEPFIVLCIELVSEKYIDGILKYDDYNREIDAYYDKYKPPKFLIPDYEDNDYDGDYKMIIGNGFSKY